MTAGGREVAAAVNIGSFTRDFGMIEPAEGQPWTDGEIETALEAYFTMLIWELDGVEYTKASVRQEALTHLAIRSEKSIDFKWCNISAVLDEAVLPHVPGYKPFPNYQRKLVPALQAWLDRNPTGRDRLT